MFSLNSQISAVIFSALNNPIDRQKCLAHEISNLAITYDGLDDINLEAIRPLVILYTNGPSSEEEILKHTEINMDKLVDYIESLKAYNFIDECNSTGKYQLTDKGSKACKDFFMNVVKRKRFELISDLEHIEIIYSKLMGLQNTE
jgi:predicted transcriptional regulator